MTVPDQASPPHKQGDSSAKNLTDNVTDEIREAIVLGHIDPGTRLIERQLAAELGVSHIPVREALATLADEGLVERLPRRGSRVTALDTRALDELAEVRATLERLVVARVLRHWDVATSAALRDLANTMIQSVTGGSVVDTGEFFRLDRQFHELMWQAADQTVLAAIAAQLYDRMSGPQRRAALSLNATAFRAQAESHLRMLTALDVDDLAMAQDESADHIRAGRIVMPDD